MNQSYRIVIDNLIVETLAFLENQGVPFTESQLVAIEPRVRAGVRKFNEFCQSMEPVFAFRATMIHITQPAMEESLERRSTRAVP